ncbi:MAG: thiamine-monophosphate kinase [Planctomycetes bacterium]|nr:thiamine-monophosphate kinase [Planctomycetota bacterium]
MELEFIDWLTRQIPAPRHPAVRIGIGDDAAVLDAGSNQEWVVTTDMLMDGTHFKLSEQAAERVGRKCLAVSLSDIAAMAAEPVAAFVSAALPNDNAAELARGLLGGMLPLARRFGCEIAGGDTNCWRGPAVIDVTVVGRCGKGRALTRSGAHPGDAIVVTGPLGGSLRGRHLDFVPRIETAIRLRAGFTLHAGCDISDGLALDLWRVAKASGCGALLEAKQIPIHGDAVSESTISGRDPLWHALGDGEDFELLFAVPPSEVARLVAEATPETPLVVVGRFVPEPGLWLEDPDGTRRPLEPVGYRHGT